MDFIRKVTSWFKGRAAAASPKLPVAAQCHRCGEIVHGQVNLLNDLSIDYDDGGSVTGYHCRKVLLGAGRCFQKIEITLTFDAGRQLVDKEIVGGKFVAEQAS